jgi:hypothetical protein
MFSFCRTKKKEVATFNLRKALIDKMLSVENILKDLQDFRMLEKSAEEIGIITKDFKNKSDKIDMSINCLNDTLKVPKVKNEISIVK